VTCQVRPALTRRERRTFRDLPTRLHGSDPAFVPLLDAAFAALMDRKRNPFWRRARSREWLAWDGNRPVGRIGACRDEALFDAVPGTGSTGFFDCGDDPEVARALFDAARSWLAKQGCSRVRGPLNYTIHDTAGLLVEGFTTPPVIDTTWNPPYYQALWEGCGWRGAKDLLGAEGPISAGTPPRAARFAKIARRKGIKVRPLDLARFDDEVARIWEVYNEAWVSNWGHVAISLEEFAFTAKDLRPVLDPGLVRVAEHDGAVVGFMLGLPDLNPAIRRSGGRLLPFGWWRILRSHKRCRRVRVVALGVVPSHRMRGVEALLLSESFQAIEGRYDWSEASWVLADNSAMLNGLALYRLTPYKRWRLYECELAS